LFETILRTHLKRSKRFERYKCSRFENIAINKSYFNYMSVTEGLKVRAVKCTCLNLQIDDKIRDMLQLSEMVRLIVYTN